MAYPAKGGLVPFWIAGREVPAATSSRTLDVFDPATGEVARKCPLGTFQDVDAAVRAAHDAFPAWSATPPIRRARIMFKFKDLLEKNADLIAETINAEHGKTLSDAAGELTRGVEVVEFACGIPHLMKGELTADVGPGIDAWSIRQSLGVCAGISPFKWVELVRREEISV